MKVICVTETSLHAEYIIGIINTHLRYDLMSVLDMRGLFDGVDVFDNIFRYCCISNWYLSEYMKDVKHVTYKEMKTRIDAQRQKYRSKEFTSYKDIDEIMEFLDKSLIIYRDRDGYKLCLESDDIFIK